MGAGGISNAFPELVHDAGKGATFDLRQVPLEETGLAPKEIWSNAVSYTHLDVYKRQRACRR